MELELKRRQQSGNCFRIVSPAVMAAMGTVLTNKYAEGYRVTITAAVQM